MKSTAKAEALVRDLKERIDFRISGSATIDTSREAKDANGWPLLFLSDGGTETAGNPVIMIRIKAVDAVSKDVFGNALVAFAPHTLEFAYELDGTEGEPSRIDIMKIQHECTKIGADKLQVKEVADATAVDETSLDATAVAAEIGFDVVWPSKGI